MRPDLRASVGLRVSTELAWAVLSDYEGWADWVPSLRGAQLLAREGDVLMLELQGERRWILELVETAGSGFCVAEVDRYGSRALKGSCELVEASDHRALRLEVEIFGVAPWWRPVLRSRLEHRLGEALGHLSARCLRIAASPFAEDPAMRTTLLELRSDGDEIELRFGGHVARFAREDTG